MQRAALALTALLSTQAATQALAKEVPAGFRQERVSVEGANLNVYTGGHGEPLVLLHGYAESALMWTPVMNALKERFQIIVPDLRGAGLSDAPAGGYDKVTMARDVKQVLEHYHVAKANVVGHDIGLMVAYAFAATYPQTTLRLAVMDAFVPGVGPGDDIYNSPDIWHFRFHGPYAEKLVEGRERVFLDSLWEGFSARPHGMNDADKDYYVAQYSRPGRMHAGFEWFKAFPKDAADNKVLARTKLSMPVLAMGGEKALGAALVETMKVVAPNLQSKVLANTGHWMLEENPTETVSALAAFLESTAAH